MRSLQHTLKTNRRDRSAFTLVEMLISVTLVLLMMTLFASIFQMASGSMGKQRAISEHDQRARTLTNILRKDFQKRTIRYPFAFYPGEVSATSPTSFPARSGYFYLSTNDANSSQVVVQFTVNANIVSEDPDLTPFFGAAAELLDRRSTGGSPPGLAISPNQPETDDGSIAPNFVGSSPAAEVCYFVRHGNLYRRVLLVRDPISYAGQNLAPQPTARSGYDYFSGQPDPASVATYDGLYQTAAAGLSNDFYRQFDYSAFTMGGAQQSATFLGTSSLGNETVGAAAAVLAIPNRRFGFNHVNPFAGIPREFTVAPGAGLGVPRFIGRFTHAETSTLNFNWPQRPAAAEPGVAADAVGAAVLAVDMDHNGTTETTTNGNPFDIVGCPLPVNPVNGLISAFDASVAGEGRGGSRRMEDLLLANVHELRIEVWDERLRRYVTPGHLSVNPATGQRGDFHVSRCLNHAYRTLPGAGGESSIGKIFDTWHPALPAVLDFDNAGGLTAVEQNPPYLPYNFYPPLPAANGPPVPSTGGIPGPPTPSAEDPRNKGYWTSNTAYTLDDVVFVPWVDAPPLNGVFDYNEIPEPKFNIAYRCITPGTSAAAPPGNFPTASGRKLTESTGVQWESFDNRRPVRSLRIQIRFVDKPSDTMRQVSLIIPMSEE